MLYVIQISHMGYNFCESIILLVLIELLEIFTYMPILMMTLLSPIIDVTAYGLLRLIVASDCLGCCLGVYNSWLYQRWLTYSNRINGKNSKFLLYIVVSLRILGGAMSSSNVRCAFIRSTIFVRYSSTSMYFFLKG